MPKPKISTPSGSETKDLFFLWSSIGILCFVIAAFVLKVIVQPERLARYTPLVIVHATLMIVWLILFAVQAGLIKQGSFSIHRKLGRLSPVLVISFIASGLMVAFNLSAEFDKPEQFVVNSYMLIIFALLYAGALFSVSKGRVEWHKRLMLIGVLNLLIPAYARFCNIFNVGEIYAVLFHFIVVLVLPIAYDLHKRRRVHIGTTIGIIVSFLILGLGIVFLSPVEGMVRSWYEV